MQKRFTRMILAMVTAAALAAPSFAVSADEGEAVSAVQESSAAPAEPSSGTSQDEEPVTPTQEGSTDTVPGDNLPDPPAESGNGDAEGTSEPGSAVIEAPGTGGEAAAEPEERVLKTDLMPVDMSREVTVRTNDDPRADFVKTEARQGIVRADDTFFRVFPAVGTMAVGSAEKGTTVYLLETVGDGWYFAESGEVRGFVPAKDILPAKETREKKNGCTVHEEKTALPLMDPLTNPVLFYTYTTALLYREPSGNDLAAYAAGFAGSAVQSREAILASLKMYEFVPAQTDVLTEELLVSLSAEKIGYEKKAPGDILAADDGSFLLVLGGEQMLKNDGETGLLGAVPLDLAGIHAVYRVAKEPFSFYYPTDNTFISKENTPNAYFVAQSLVEHGFSKEAASGVVGCLFAETGGLGERDLDPARYEEAEAFRAGGMLCWTDNGSSQGFTALQVYAAERGRDWRDIGLQTEYLIQDFARRWQFAGSIGSAAELMTRGYTVHLEFTDFAGGRDARQAAIDFLGVYGDDLYRKTAEYYGYTLDAWVARECAVRTNLAGACYNAFFGSEDGGQVPNEEM